MAHQYEINDKTILFVHIPKTGGTSISKELDKYRSINDEIRGHLTYKECIDGINQDLTFSVVRNPWDWRCSWFFYVKDKPKESGCMEIYKIIKDMSFDDHIRWMYNNKDLVYKLKDIFIKPQYDYLRGGEITVLKLENIKDDFKNLMQRVGLNIELNMHANRSKNNEKNYKDLYNEETIKMVAELYKKDIEVFNYEFNR